jgi:hypothetical protein
MQGSRPGETRHVACFSQTRRLHPLCLRELFCYWRSLQHAENQASEQQRNVRAASEALPEIPLQCVLLQARLADIGVKRSVLQQPSHRIRYR